MARVAYIAYPRDATPTLLLSRLEVSLDHDRSRASRRESRETDFEARFRTT